MFYPLTFKPIFQERIWGGRALQELFAKPLPPGVSIGESWEISDRPDAVSVVANGPLAGKTLSDLLRDYQQELVGKVSCPKGRFPLLVKLLDAQENLSLQVHPSAELAASFKGEPKTEMWYIAKAAPGASLYVGLKAGTTKEEFAACIEQGTVAECFHAIPVQAGDAMFLPSGRVHALGKGLVIFEIQQNSDTTYRVFDWNRVDSSGKSRQLHVRESLQCIDFQDYEPCLIAPEPFATVAKVQAHSLVRHPLFDVDLMDLEQGASFAAKSNSVQIIGCVSGRLAISGGGESVEISAGSFVMLPAALREYQVRSLDRSRYLLSHPN
ncbi:MAG: type I phosphomannose isomerase catalytic subunit [Verrucomicrobiota bacterium]|nr:type I phosphomannose isomerase catalytic subunit [Verrucomicrobiota bacterium]